MCWTLTRSYPISTMQWIVGSKHGRLYLDLCGWFWLTPWPPGTQRTSHLRGSLYINVWLACGYLGHIYLISWIEILHAFTIDLKLIIKRCNLTLALSPTQCFPKCFQQSSWPATSNSRGTCQTASPNTSWDMNYCLAWQADRKRRI